MFLSQKKSPSPASLLLILPTIAEAGWGEGVLDDGVAGSYNSLSGQQQQQQRWQQSMRPAADLGATVAEHFWMIYVQGAGVHCTGLFFTMCSFVSADPHSAFMYSLALDS